jgi:predicted DNA-binding protein YlxM (UPF0122 family)
MEEAVFRTMLFDFYGELLTEKQREYFHLHYNEDMSLAEIAQSEGISRQGVWDIIRRGEESLRRFEEKTSLVARFAAQRRTVAELEQQLHRLLPLTEGEARRLTEGLTEKIQELRHGI